MNLYFENLYKSYQGKTILENLNGKINSGDRIGLIGVNGVGKTTLVKLLCCKENSDIGSIRYSPASVKILHVEQYPKFDKSISVYDEIYKTVLTRAGSIRNADVVIKKNLNEIGLGSELWNQKADTLSGGEKTKLLLCKSLVSDFDFLILDEPTNHLDLVSCEWLEEYLIRLSKTLLVISHDRFFLDSVCNKIWELRSKGLHFYEGNYSDFKVQKENETIHLRREYEKQRARMQDLNNTIHERANWYASAHKSAGQNDFYRSKAKKHASVMQAKKRELERLENNKIDKPEKAVSPAFDIINKGIINKKLPPVLVRIENLCKKYGDRTVFRDLSFNVMRGDKIALLGANGAGKTTLLKIINGLDKYFQGAVTVNPSVRIGYFAQEMSNLNSNATVLEDILSMGARVDEARLLLAGLLFKGDDVRKRIADLSMGEQCRVAFAKLILSGANLLILDEPTNYMDITSKEKVEEVLDDFKGTVIFVSHDRYFTKRIATRVLSIQNKGLRCYDGNYEYYVCKEKEQAARGKVGLEAGLDFNQISDNIRRLECELAFLSGRLAEPLEEEEKRQLNDEFIKVARELTQNKQALKRSFS